MAKAWDDFRKEYDDKTLKGMENAVGEIAKIKQDALKFLKEAWAKEDLLAETIPKARLKGITGKKAADFRGDSDFTDALGKWKKAVEAYRNEIDALREYSDGATKAYAAMKRKRDAAEKDLKKSKGAMNSKEEKEAVTALKKSGAILDGLKKTGSTFGTLKTHEVFYAAKLNASIDAIVANAVKECDGDELPDFLEEDKRGKTLKSLDRMKKNIVKFASVASSQAEGDGDEVKKAQKSLKMAAEHKNALDALHKEHQTAFKKQKKVINAHNDKKAMLAVIDKIAKTHKKYVKIYEDAEDKVLDAVSVN
ncbi:hypothetical protein [Sedimentitalea nanhaiensis]|uniref:Uncharacterized protein n=1 Tax=Sedimentitalea nanhaiensis TaxID=999627 RepID=A0A1I7D2B9_9RHOB|nr:hypothetical protein [Sedimentitalea nanhaiensis]SFU05803.1 hypothetical protein SAMN05216236_12215 [Sedimentitalea nanhaiensis]